MAFTDAIRALNGLKRQRVIRDYVIIGAVASTAYMEPMFTEDLDVVVLVDSDEEYLEVFRRIGETAASMSGMHYVLEGVPVQLFPSTTKPLYRDTLDNAEQARIGSQHVKIAPVEHLILLFLEAYREKDRFRVRLLLPQADMHTLNRLLERFDHDRTLASRLQRLRREGDQG